MSRSACIERQTAETAITLDLELDGDGTSHIATGIGFFDHMLTHIAKHGGVNLRIAAQGDLQVDEHHTVEDVGLCLGQAIARAVGDKVGISRYGWAFVPMDEALARTIIDLSGRSYLVFNTTFSRELVNGFPLELVKEFFRAVATEAKMNLHMVLLYGDNAHHQSEALFKSFGRALRVAVKKSGPAVIPSTKGIL